ncbi:hypothetical protein BC832DRAFT_590149 [Gaertneriomyces semiglobifer]|nr:hypothetical protein BC832DRAFT_590149 [Gaertneriomyces semiglobifer]
MDDPSPSIIYGWEDISIPPTTEESEFLSLATSQGHRSSRSTHQDTDDEDNHHTGPTARVALRGIHEIQRENEFLKLEKRGLEVRCERGEHQREVMKRELERVRNTLDIKDQEIARLRGLIERTANSSESLASSMNELTERSYRVPVDLLQTTTTVQAENGRLLTDNARLKRENKGLKMALIVLKREAVKRKERDTAIQTIAEQVQTPEVIVRDMACQADLIPPASRGPVPPDLSSDVRQLEQDKEELISRQKQLDETIMAQSKRIGLLKRELDETVGIKIDLETANRKIKKTLVSMQEAIRRLGKEKEELIIEMEEESQKRANVENTLTDRDHKIKELDGRIAHLIEEKSTAVKRISQLEASLTEQHAAAKNLHQVCTSRIETLLKALKIIPSAENNSEPLLPLPLDNLDVPIPDLLTHHMTAQHTDQLFVLQSRMKSLAEENSKLQDELCTLYKSARKTTKDTERACEVLREKVVELEKELKDGRKRVKEAVEIRKVVEQKARELQYEHNQLSENLEQLTAVNKRLKADMLRKDDVLAGLKHKHAILLSAHEELEGARKKLDEGYKNLQKRYAGLDKLYQNAITKPMTTTIATQTRNTVPKEAHDLKALKADYEALRATLDQLQRRYALLKSSLHTFVSTLPPPSSPQPTSPPTPDPTLVKANQISLELLGIPYDSLLRRDSGYASVERSGELSSTLDTILEADDVEKELPLFLAKVVGYSDEDTSYGTVVV